MRHIRTLILALAAVFIAGCNDTGNTQPVVVSEISSWPPPAPPGAPVADDLLADNYEVVIDASGSMGDRSCGTGDKPRMETAKAGAIAFGNMLTARANLGLVVFSAAGRPSIENVIRLGINNRDAFRNAVGAIEPHGNTPLGPAMELGAQELTLKAQAQRGYGTYHLVVVTDGLANSGINPQTVAYRILRTTPIQVHVIGFCLDGNHPLDMKGYTHYSSANDLRSLVDGFKAILAESESFQDSAFTK